MWRVYNAMLSTGLLSMKNRVVYFDDFSGCKFCSLMGKGHSFSQLYNSTVPLAVLVKYQQGGYYFPQLESPAYFSFFKQRALRVISLEPTLRSGTHVVGVFKKSGSGSHGFTNHDSIVKHLKWRGFEVIEIVHPENMTVREEITLMQKMDVFLTPSGGGSFGALFLRNGASAVFGNICGRGDNNDRRKHSKHVKDLNTMGRHMYCLRLESYLWDHVGFLRKSYISPEGVSDLVATKKKTEFNDPYHKMLLYAFSLSLDRIDQILNEVIQNAAPLHPPQENSGFENALEVLPPHSGFSSVFCIQGEHSEAFLGDGGK
jgi:hypothetical protein